MEGVKLTIQYPKHQTLLSWVFSFEAFLGGKKVVRKHRFDTKYNGVTRVLPGTHTLELRRFNDFTKHVSSTFFEVEIPNARSCVLDIRLANSGWFLGGFWLIPQVRDAVL